LSCTALVWHAQDLGEISRNTYTHTAEREQGRKLFEGIAVFSKIPGKRSAHANKISYFHMLTINKWKPKFKTHFFIITPNKMKFLSIDLPKHKHNLYIKNCRLLVKEIKEP
jgi:capsule polysaccharide export protein KpsC/LpsZ